MVVKKEILINADLEKVYEIAETYPLFVKFYKEKKIISNSNNKLILSMSSKIFGITFKWQGEGVRYPFNRIEYKQTKGLLEGMRSLWSFEKLVNTTKVVIRNEIQIRFFLGKLIEFLIGNFVIRGYLEKILFDLKESSEMNTYGEN